MTKEDCARRKWLGLRLGHFNPEGREHCRFIAKVNEHRGLSNPESHTAGGRTNI